MKWTMRQIKYLAKHYPSVDDPRKLAAEMGISYSSLRCKVRVLKLRRTKHARGGKSTSTPEIDRYLKRNYLKVPQKVMAKNVGKSGTFIKIRLRQLGLEIPQITRDNFKAANQFKRGHISANKGKKMPADVYEKCKATMFSKSHKPQNRKPGKHHLSIRTDKTGRPYIYIKIKDSRWILYHRYLWMRAHGITRMSSRKILRFKNGDSSDVRLDNLELVDRAEHMRRNTYLNLPPELQDTIRLKARLTRTINKLQNQQDNGNKK